MQRIAELAAKVQAAAKILCAAFPLPPGPERKIMEFDPVGLRK
jgi:hypothetical protein